MSATIGSGIPLGNPFDVSANVPADSRNTQANIAARNAIAWKYDGLECYVESEKQAYTFILGHYSGSLLDNNNWVPTNAIEPDIIGPGTFTKVSVNSKGRVISGALITTDDVGGLIDIGTGKFNQSLMPAISIIDTFVRNSQAAMLALVAEQGDICIRTDINKSFILTDNNPSSLASWQEILTASGTVSSVSLSMPNSEFAVSNPTITSAGTFGVTWKSQLAATVFAAPSNSLGTPTFRILEIGDIYSLYDALDEKENRFNKANTLLLPNHTTYPSTLAVANALATKVNIANPAMEGSAIISSAGSLEIRTGSYNNGIMHTNQADGAFKSVHFRAGGDATGNTADFITTANLTHYKFDKPIYIGTDKLVQLSELPGPVDISGKANLVGGNTFTGNQKIGSATGTALLNIATEVNTSTSPLKVVGAKAAGSSSSGFAIAQNGGRIDIKSGEGGNALGNGTNVAGIGGEIYILAGDGGQAIGGTTNTGGNGGAAILQGGTALGNGIGGSAQLKAGNSATGYGGHVYIVAGAGSGGITDAATAGAIVLNGSDGNNIRGNTLIGLLPIDDDRATRLQVGGNGKFTGTVSIAEPTANSHATTKFYVDEVITNLDISSKANLVGGNNFIGTQRFDNTSPAHPSDYTTIQGGYISTYSVKVGAMNLYDGGSGGTLLLNDVARLSQSNFFNSPQEFGNTVYITGTEDPFTGNRHIAFRNRPMDPDETAVTYLRSEGAPTSDVYVDLPTISGRLVVDTQLPNMNDYVDRYTDQNISGVKDFYDRPLHIGNPIVSNDGGYYDISVYYSNNSASSDWAFNSGYSDSAGNTENWNGVYLDLSELETNPDFLMSMRGGVGRIMNKAWSKSWHGLNDGSTLNNNISGSATNWNGYTLGTTVLDTGYSPAVIYVKLPSANTLHPMQAGGIREFLGLPATGGYNLQDVTSRGYTTTNPIHISTNISSDWASTVINNSTTGYGLYAKSLGGIAFRVDTSVTASAIQINDNGNVGINTASPGAKLDVNGSIYSNASILSNTFGGYSGGDVILTTNTSGASKLIFKTANSERATLDADGNFVVAGSVNANRFGAGYDSGVAGSINTNEYLRISGNGGVFWASNAIDINNQDLNDDTLTLQTYNALSIGLKLKTYGNVTRGYIYANSSNEIGFLNNAGAWSLRIDSAGNNYAAGDIHAVNHYGQAYYAANWFRSAGSTGWINETYGGGIYMLDSTYVRVYGGHQFYAENWIGSTTGFLAHDYGVGLVGRYSPTRYQNVFSMGTSYVMAADGTSLGSHYGIAWTHTNMGGESKVGLGHQALFTTNGVTQSAIGTGIWTIDNIIVGQTTGAGKGISLYDDNWVTGLPSYGLAFSQTSNFGTHGNVSGDWATYLTMNGGATRGWIFRHLSNGNVASIDATGNATFNGYVTATGGAGTSDIRLKNLLPLNKDLSWLDEDRTIAFTWKQGELDNRVHYGYSAQDIDLFAPELVFKDNKDKHSLNQTELLILEVKRLKQRVALLERNQLT